MLRELSVLESADPAECDSMRTAACALSRLFRS